MVLLRKTFLWADHNFVLKIKSSVEDTVQDIHSSCLTQSEISDCLNASSCELVQENGNLSLLLLTAQLWPVKSKCPRPSLPSMDNAGT